MAFPPINSAVDPVVIPPVPEKVFPNWFIRRMGASLIPPNDNGVVVFVPYNQETGEMYPDTTQDYQIDIQHFWGEAQRVPAFGQAVYALSLAIDMMFREHQVKTQMDALTTTTRVVTVPEGGGEPVVTFETRITDQAKYDELAAKLAAIHTEMGI